MIGIAFSTMRARLVSFVGSFLALALGVGMLATIALVMFSGLGAPDAAPERFATAPVVVRADDQLTVDVSGGTDSIRLAEPPGLTPAIIDRLSALGPVTVDRSFPVDIADVPAGLLGHPWPVARFGTSTLSAGTAPATDHDIVLSGGSARPGDQIAVSTPQGRTTYTVTGTVDGPAAVYFTEDEAARLSPRVNAVVVEGSAAAVRQAVGTDAQVLTGADRRLADPDPDHASKALLNMNVLLGVAGGLAAFVAVFVVSSTFAFAVVQRRRELALLRTIGGTPRQIRRMVLAEAGILGTAGALAGCLLSLIGAPVLTSWLVDRHIAPAGFALSIGIPPLALALVLGVAVALVGAFVAARRAASVPPVDALRDAAVDARVMSRARWTWGLGLLAAGVIGMGFVAVRQPALATVQVVYLWALMLPVAALAVLAPAVLPGMVRVLSWPFIRSRGAVGLLVRENTLAAIRRTAATAAPVLLTVGLSGTLLGAVATTDQAAGAGQANRLLANYVVLPDDADGLDTEALDRLRAVPDVAVDTVTPVKVYTVEGGEELRDRDVDVIDPSALSRSLALPVLTGSVTDLTDDSIIITDAWEHTTGDKIQVWLADGTPVTLRVAAVIRTGVGGPDAYLSPRYAGSTAPQQAYVTVHSGANVTGATLGTALADPGTRVATREDWSAEAKSSRQGSSLLGLYLTLLVTAVYSAIAIVNTMVMAASGRLRELAVLRLTGATTRQVLRLVTSEALLVAGLGTLLAAAVTMLNLSGLRMALAKLVGATPIVVPWTALIALAVGAAVLALFGTLLTARTGLRAPAVESAGNRE